MAESKPTPDYGRRLINHLIDQLAKDEPEKVVYGYPKTRDPADGIQEITAKGFANAVNRTAHWLESCLGKSKSFEPIGYMAVQDLRYNLLLFAAVKVGYVMLFNSPRNSHAGNMSIIEKSNCNIWAIPSRRLASVENILADRPFKVIPVPDLETLLDSTLVEEFPYTKSYEEARYDPLAVLHTSGSTGIPKPITVSHALMNTTDAQQRLPPLKGTTALVSEWCGPLRIYTAFPNFHSAGISLNMLLPYFCGSTIISGPTDVPINIGIVESMFEHARAEASILPPSILDDISKSNKALDSLSKQRFILTGGGQPAKVTGDILSKYTRIQNGIGTTEGGMYPSMMPSDEDWQYFWFHSSFGIEFRDLGNGLFELFQVKNPEWQLHQGIFFTFPELEEVSTKDLYSPHPTKRDLWMYRGRADDILVLSNGEKINPTDTENIIATHPLVSAALVAGQGRFQPSVVVELGQQTPTDMRERQRLMDSIWVKIDEANVASVGHGRIQPGFMIFTSPGKPFLRAGKGTVQRAATIALYKDELDSLYQNAEAQDVDKLPILDTANPGTIKQTLQQIIIAILGHHISEEDDFFASGIDSLLVFRILRCLSRATQSRKGVTPRLTSAILYSNPTVTELSAAMSKLMNGECNTKDEKTKSDISNMKAMIKKYTSDLPHVTTPQQKPPEQRRSVVILTGSTGSLGTYILDALLKTKEVSRIYCLNRAEDGKRKQTFTSSSRGLSTNWDKVDFWQTDLSKPGLGLQEDQYHELVDQATHIIHNQWQVDFNLALSSFEPHIQGVRRLVDLATQSLNQVSLFFISSVGVATNWLHDSKVSEAPIDDFNAPGTSYGYSKFVSEHILAKAAEISKVDCVVCRVGQIAGAVGSEKGHWNPKEWFPTLISSSKFMRKVPTTIQVMNDISLLPVDDLAEIVLELARIPSEPAARGGSNNSSSPASPISTTSSSSSPSSPFAPPSPKNTSSLTIFHALNPSESSWPTSFLPTIKSFLGPDVEEVSFDAWLQALRDSAADAHNIGKNPGIPLLEFFSSANLQAQPKGEMGKQLPQFDMSAALKMSPILRSLPPAGEEWMHVWMRQWGYRQ